MFMLLRMYEYYKYFLDLRRVVRVIGVPKVRSHVPLSPHLLFQLNHPSTINIFPLHTSPPEEPPHGFYVLNYSADLF